MNSAQTTAVSIVGALVLYVLSMRPAASLLDGHPSAYYWIYYPVYWVAQKVPTVGWYLAWYVNGWRLP